MNGDELAAHLRRPARLEASRLYGLVLREREVRKWFKLYAEALKLKLELYRTGALPETLDTGCRSGMSGRGTASGSSAKEERRF